jgi:hypothetical protein
MANDWITTHCIREEGFPKELYVATARHGVSDRFEYIGREYVKDITKYYEVMVHVSASGRFLEMGP